MQSHHSCDVLLKIEGGNELIIGLSSVVTGYNPKLALRMCDELGLAGVEHLPGRYDKFEHLVALSGEYQKPFLGFHDVWWNSKSFWYWMRTSGIKGKLESLAWLMMINTAEGNDAAIRFAQKLGGYTIIHADLAWELTHELNGTIPSFAVIENVDSPHRKVPRGFGTALFMARELGLDLCLNTTHIGLCKEDLLGTFELYHGRIKVVHFSDYRTGSSDYKQGHDLPGEGNLPLAKLLKMMKEYSWNGIIIIEIKPVGKVCIKGIPIILDYERTKANVKRTLAFIHEHLR